MIFVGFHSDLRVNLQEFYSIKDFLEPGAAANRVQLGQERGEAGAKSSNEQIKARAVREEIPLLEEVFAAEPTKLVLA